jgi:hypothetical protein
MLKVVPMRAESTQTLQDELCQFVLQTQARLVQLRQQLLEARSGSWGQAVQPVTSPLSGPRTNIERSPGVAIQAQPADAGWPTHEIASSVSAPDCSVKVGQTWVGETEATTMEAATSLENRSLDRLAAIKQRLAEQLKNI